MRRLGPAVAMADSIKTAVFPPAIKLLLPADWYPELVEFQGYAVVHGEVDDAMVAVPGYRIV